MKKEDFFEVLGELDDDIVKGAESFMRWKTGQKANWRIWSAMAACLAAAVVFCISALQRNDTAVDDGHINGVGKMAVNFEGRVTGAEQGRITLDNGKTVRITEDTTVALPDGSPGEIAVGDYIQGYAENAEGSEIDAEYILITPL